ncbi:MAG: TolC family protein, partial [Vampirovibrionia bacterium]
LSEITLDNNIQPANYDLNLENSINMALDNNSIFNIQKKQTKDYKLEATKTLLDFLPTLSTAMQLSYQVNTANLSSSNMIIPGLGMVTMPSYQVEDNWKRQNTVSAIQNITGLYRKYHAKKIADLSFEKAILEEEYSKQNTASKVYNVYFDILADKYQIKALEESIKELESYYELASERYKEGTALDRDAQKVEVELDSSKYAHFVKQNDLNNKLNWFKNILGLNQQDNINIIESYTEQDTNLSSEDAVKTAIENNKKLQQAGINIKIAKHAKKETYSRYIPEFDINTSYLNQQGDDFYPQNNFAVAFNMNFEFFDWGKRVLTIKQRQLEVEQAQLYEKDTLEALEIDVKDKFNKIKEAAMLIDVSKKNVELSQRNVEISSGRYKVGMEIMSEVLKDQSELSHARSDYYYALYNKQKTITNLKQAMGVLIINEEQ